METGKFVENLLTVLPYWHYKIDRPFKQSLDGGMSLETYYCLQMLRWDGPMTMSELAGRLKITKQQATRTIDRLYACDFVKRLFDENDRRFIKIEITQKALDYIEQNIYQDTEFLKTLESRIGGAEIEELGGAIETLLRILPKLS